MRNISVVLSANTAALSAGLARGATQVRTFAAEANKALSSTDKGMRDLSRTMGQVSVGIGVGLGVGLGLATRAAIEFQAAMKDVATVLSVDVAGGRRASAAEMEAVSRSVLDLSTRLPQSANVLAKALYEIGSSGFSVQEGARGMSEAMAVLEATGAAASAGLSSADTAVRAVTGALNAYGKSGFQASEVSDTLFKSIEVGVFRLEDLAIQLGDVVGSAAAADISLEEVGAALATLTKAALPPALAATSLNQVIRSLLSPTDEMATKLAELGISLDQLADPAVGLHGVIEQLRVATGGNVTTMNDLFASVEASRGALALMTDEGRLYRDIAAQILPLTERMGATQDALATQSESAANKIQLARNQIAAARIELGQNFLPVVASTVTNVADLVAGFGELPGPVKAATTAVAGFAAVGALAAGSWALFPARIVAARAAMSSMSSAAAGAGINLGKLGRAVGILGVLFVKYLDTLGEAKAAEAARVAEVDSLTEAYVQQAAGVDNATRAFAHHKLETEGVLGAGKRLGLDTKTMIDAYLGQEDAVRRVNRALRDHASAKAKVGSFILRETDRKVGGEAAADINLLTGALEGSREKNEEAAAAAKEYERSVGPAGDASSEAAGKVDRLGLALQGLSGAQQSAVKSMASAAPTLSTVYDRLAAAQKSMKSSSGPSAAQQEIALAGARIRVARADLNLIDATRRLDSARAASVAPMLARAERDLGAATDASTRAAFSLLDAERALAEARSPARNARTRAEAEISVARAGHAQAEALGALTSAQEKLAFAREGGDPREVAAAERELQEAMFRQRETVWAMADAQAALARLREDGGRAAVEAEMSLRDAQRAVAESQQATAESAQALATARHDAATSRVVVEAELELREAILGVKAAHEDLRDAQSDRSGVDAFVAGNEEISVSLATYEQGLADDIAAHEQWAADLSVLARRTSDTVVSRVASMGVQRGGILRQMLSTDEATFDRQTRLIEQSALLQSAAWNASLADFRRNGKLTAEESEKLLHALVEELDISLSEARRLLRLYGGDLADAAGAPVIAWSAGRLPAGNGRPGMPERAKGGVDAGIYTRQLIKFAEPQTGGELYLPRRGISRDRAAMLLAAGAEWYGFGVTAMAKGGTTPAPPDFRSHWAEPVAMPPQRVADLWHAMATASASQSGKPLGQGAGWRAMMEALHQVFPGLRLISGLRPGAITATGRPSYHGMGRAVDLPPRRDVFDWIAANYAAPTRELIFSPAGGRQIHNGRPHVYGEPTRSMHFDHLHWAMRRGGVLPVRSYDSGGYLPTGTSVAVNGTGRPEPVGHHLTPQPTGRMVTVENSGNITVNVRADAGVDVDRLAKLVRVEVEPVVAGAMRSLSVELDQS